MKTIARAIRASTPTSLRKFVHRVGDYFGTGLPHYFPAIESSLKTLKSLGFNPQFCVDIGAYTGEWARMFRSIFPDSRILVLEAQEGKRLFLEKLVTEEPGKIDLRISLLGPDDGREVDFIEMETGSSVFEENSDYYPRVRVLKKTSRLDTILEDGGFPKADMIKLDVQGYELEVLKGAQAALSHAIIVLMEASLIPINKGCPSIAEVIDFMDTAGFVLFDFCSQMRRPDGALRQTDLLFIRKDANCLPLPTF